MCDKDVHRCFFVFDSIPDQYKTQEICDIVVSLYLFLTVYYPDKYITQRMCDEAVDNSLDSVDDAALKLILYLFITSKIIKKLYTDFYTVDNVIHFNENVIFPCNEMSILGKDLNNIYFDNNFVEDDADTIIHIRLLAWHSKFKKRKALKKR